MAGQDGYMLNRDTSASLRLTSQHFLWSWQLGWNLHPDIVVLAKAANERVAVADVATGNGIWIIDEARNHQEIDQFVGFDISDVQLPRSETWPSNVKFDVFDATKAVPDELRGRFDVVHCRLIMGVVRGGNTLPFVECFKALLKPGGYLQWGELYTIPMYFYPKEKSTPEWENYGMGMIDSVRPGAVDHDWILERPESLRHHGFVDVVEVLGGPAKPELMKYWSDNTFASLEEIAAAIGAGQEVFTKLAEGRKEGWDSYFEPRVVIARKPPS